MQTTFIYAHLEPDIDEIRYIGKSNAPRCRLSGHVSGCGKERTHQANWVRALMRRGLRPRLEIIAEVPRAEWEFWETHYIKYFRDSGFQLTNATPGGEGVGSGPDHPRFGLPGANRGRPVSLETRSKMRAAKLGLPGCRRGQPVSLETRTKMRAAKLGKKLTAAHREAIGVAGKGRAPSATCIEAIRIAQTGRIKTPEEIEKRRETMRAKRERKP